MKQLAGYALIVIVAVLTLYFGVRFINAVFNDVEKKQATTTSATVKNTSDWNCRVYYGHDGEYVQYDDEAVCRERAAQGATVIRIWEGRK